MKYFYYWLWYLKLKPYYLQVIKILKDIFFSFLSYIYIFTGINFKIGGSKK